MNIRSTRRLVMAGFLLVAALAACTESGPPARDLTELVQEDSTYYDPSTGEPYTGPVFRTFADEPSKVEISAELKDGTWHDEMVIYHASGRLRYMGAFWEGERCGPWTENLADRESESVFEDVVREVQTMAMYPPCPEELSR